MTEPYPKRLISQEGGDSAPGVAAPGVPQDPEAEAEGEGIGTGSLKPPTEDRGGPGVAEK